MTDEQLSAILSALAEQADKLAEQIVRLEYLGGLISGYDERITRYSGVSTAVQGLFLGFMFAFVISYTFFRRR